MSKMKQTFFTLFQPGYFLSKFLKIWFIVSAKTILQKGSDKKKKNSSGFVDFCWVESL